MNIIVDAYNVIFKVPELGDSTKKCDIEDLRERFLLVLKKYKAERKHKLIVVFDGQGFGHSNIVKDSGVDVVFSRPGLDADEEIKRLVSNSEHPRQIVVVTEDRDIIHFVKKHGCKVMGPLEFYGDVIKKTAQQASSKRGIKKTVDGSEPISKYIGPSKAEAQYWLKVFSEKTGNLSDD